MGVRVTPSLYTYIQLAASDDRFSLRRPARASAREIGQYRTQARFRYRRMTPIWVRIVSRKQVSPGSSAYKHAAQASEPWFVSLQARGASK